MAVPGAQIVSLKDPDSDEELEEAAVPKLAPSTEQHRSPQPLQGLQARPAVLPAFVPLPPPGGPKRQSDDDEEDIECAVCGDGDEVDGSVSVPSPMLATSISTPNMPFTITRLAMYPIHNQPWQCCVRGCPPACGWAPARCSHAWRPARRDTPVTQPRRWQRLTSASASCAQERHPAVRWRGLQCGGAPGLLRRQGHPRGRLALRRLRRWAGPGRRALPALPLRRRRAAPCGQPRHCAPTRRCPTLHPSFLCFPAPWQPFVMA
jgi:hypothetical protein